MWKHGSSTSSSWRCKRSSTPGEQAALVCHSRHAPACAGQHVPAAPQPGAAVRQGEQIREQSSAQPAAVVQENHIVRSCAPHRCDAK
eukprot:1153431-Pelagomonas_calceolata.AAC.3